MKNILLASGQLRWQKVGQLTSADVLYQMVGLCDDIQPLSSYVQHILLSFQAKSKNTFWHGWPCILGGPIVFEDLTDSPENQHVFLSLLQNLKSKISEKSGQNWSCNKLKTNSISQTQPAGQIWWLSSQEGQNCCNFSFVPIFVKFWIFHS